MSTALNLPSRFRIEPFRLHRPTTLAAAMAHFADGATPMAGGIDLIDQMKLGARHDALVVLTHIPELRDVALHGGDLYIGATVTHGRLADDALVGKHLPGVAAAFAGIANMRIRDKGTVGGNIMAGMPGYEAAAIFAALDATVEFLMPDGTHRLVPVLQANRMAGLLKRVRIPKIGEVRFWWDRSHRDSLSLAVGRRNGATKVAVCPIAHPSFDFALEALGSTPFPGADHFYLRRVTEALLRKVPS